MTYKQLLEILSKFTPEQLALKVVVFDLNELEYTPAIEMGESDSHCKLADGHPTILFDSRKALYIDSKEPLEKALHSRKEFWEQVENA